MDWKTTVNDNGCTPSLKAYMETRIELEGGKYTVLHEYGLNFRALRHGEEWRDLTGDGLILAMAHRIEELEEAMGLRK